MERRDEAAVLFLGCDERAVLVDGGTETAGREGRDAGLQRVTDGPAGFRGGVGQAVVGQYGRVDGGALSGRVAVGQCGDRACLGVPPRPVTAIDRPRVSA